MMFDVLSEVVEGRGAGGRKKRSIGNKHICHFTPSMVFTSWRVSSWHALPFYFTPVTVSAHSAPDGHFWFECERGHRSGQLDPLLTNRLFLFPKGGEILPFLHSDDVHRQ